MITRVVILTSCLVLATSAAVKAELSAQVGGGSTIAANRYIPDKGDEHHDSLNQAASASVSAENGNGSYTSQVTTSRTAGKAIKLQADVHTRASAALPAQDGLDVPSIFAFAIATYSEKLARVQVPAGFTMADDTYIYFTSSYHSDTKGGLVPRVYFDLESDGQLELEEQVNERGDISAEFAFRRSVTFFSSHDVNFTLGLFVSTAVGNAEGQYNYADATISHSVDLQCYIGDVDGKPVPGTENIKLLTSTGMEIPLRAGVGSNLPFFYGQAALGSGAYYLAFPNGNPFGYYSFLGDPSYLYHFDLGYEYIFDAHDANDGVYLYDFKSGGFFYTSPSFAFPYLYDFSLNSVVYYYPDPNNPGRYNTDGNRFFYVFSTGQIIVK